MAKNGVNINITGDSKGAENALKKVGKKANELAKQIKKTGQAAALKQINAEQMLVAAVKNNPYLNSKSVNELTGYARALRGHETDALVLMARLAGEGRPIQIRIGYEDYRLLLPSAIRFLLFARPRH